MLRNTVQNGMGVRFDRNSQFLEEGGIMKDVSFYQLLPLAAPRSFGDVCIALGKVVRAGFGGDMNPRF